jgi:hypothetical protein
MWVAFAVAVVLFIVGTLVWTSGLIVPQLVSPGGLQASSVHVSGLARFEFAVSNAGRFPVTVLDVGRSAPGLELIQVRGGVLDHAAASPLPVTLPPGTGVVVVLIYRITACDTPPQEDWPLTALVERPWGAMTVEVPSDPQGAGPWQEHLIDLWCDPQAWRID